MELQKRNPIQVGSYLGVIYWDGTSEGSYDINVGPDQRRVFTSRDGVLGYYDGTKLYEYKEPGWYNAKEFSKGQYDSFKVMSITHVGQELGRLGVWIPGLPKSTSTQPMLDESRPVAMAIDRNGTPIVTKVVSAKKKVVV